MLSVLANRIIAIVWVASILIVLVDLVVCVARVGIHSGFIGRTFVLIVFAPACALIIIGDWLVKLNDYVYKHITNGPRGPF